MQPANRPPYFVCSQSHLSPGRLMLVLNTGLDLPWGSHSWPFLLATLGGRELHSAFPLAQGAKQPGKRGMLVNKWPFVRKVN
jgi:hypothetical protein